MRTTLIFAVAASCALAACGGSDAEQGHEERADQLREAAEQSTPEAANVLENIAERHEQAAEGDAPPPADPAHTGAAMPEAAANTQR